VISSNTSLPLPDASQIMVENSVHQNAFQAAVAWLDFLPPLNREQSNCTQNSSKKELHKWGSSFLTGWEILR